MAAINQYYDNFVLENEINEMYDTQLNMLQFCTPDTSLQAVAGDKIKVNVYDATSVAEEVGLGEGNSDQIKVTLTNKEFEVKTVQTRFAWLDEEARRDPIVPVVGAQKAVASLVNKMNADVLAEMDKATLAVKASGDYFADFIDAVATLSLDKDADYADESLTPGANCFALINKKDLAKLRKSAKDSIQYVKEFVTDGYVGTLAGVNIYVSNLVKEGTVPVGHKSALKLITKESISTETDRDVNERRNWVYERQVYVAVLYDPTKLCVINATGTGASTSDKDSSEGTGK